MNNLLGLTNQYREINKTDKVFFSKAEYKYGDILNTHIGFIETLQLMDTGLWDIITKIFSTDIDDSDNGWRCEFWGNLMCGACLIYEYTKREHLYEVLTEAVKDMLKKQDDLGRFSTYSIKNEFHGRDIYGRKNIITGFLSYYDICYDENIKKEIIDAIKLHMDYIMQKADNNVALIEPAVKLYNVTNDEKYINFADGILKNITDFENEVIKTNHSLYDIITNFVGIIEYYRLSKDKKYIEEADKFFERMTDREITIVGSAGSKFLEAKIMQTDKKAGFVQETCVTVAWMRFCSQMFCITGDIKYIREFEKSAYNALAGSVNTQLVKSDKGLFPFDSSSPLIKGTRGNCVKDLQDIGSFNYGSFAAIGAVGLGLVPKMSVMQTKDGIKYNMYFNGIAKIFINDSDTVEFALNVDYINNGEIKITLIKSINEEFTIDFRIPEFVKNAELGINGDFEKVNSSQYYSLKRVWKTNDEVVIKFDTKLLILKPLKSEHKYVAFKYGPYVLARDLRFCKDTGLAVFVSDDELKIQIEEKASNNYVFKSKVYCGKRLVSEMIDYASAGRTQDERSLMEVWLLALTLK